MVGMLLLAFGVAIGSALVPVVSVELFVLASVAAEQEQAPPWWALGVVVAVGQVAGKLLYFYAARGDLRLPDFVHRRTHAAAGSDAEDPSRPVRPSGASRLRHAWRTTLYRCRVWLCRIRAKCHAHPRWMFGTHTVSSVVGLPPFMLTTVLAGFSGMSLARFLLASLPGRFLRFALLALSPEVVFGHHLFV